MRAWEPAPCRMPTGACDWTANNLVSFFYTGTSFCVVYIIREVRDSLLTVSRENQESSIQSFLPVLFSSILYSAPYDFLHSLVYSIRRELLGLALKLVFGLFVFQQSAQKDVINVRFIRQFLQTKPDPRPVSASPPVLCLC